LLPFPDAICKSTHGLWDHGEENGRTPFSLGLKRTWPEKEVEKNLLPCKVAKLELWHNLKNEEKEEKDGEEEAEEEEGEVEGEEGQLEQRTQMVTKVVPLRLSISDTIYKN